MFRPRPNKPASQTRRTRSPAVTGLRYTPAVTLIVCGNLEGLPMRRLAGLCVFVLLSSVACGSSTTGPSSISIVHSCGAGTFTGSMTATVGGQSFTATCLLAASSTNNIIAFGGTNVSASNPTNFDNITFAVTATGPGTFTLGPSGNNASLSIGDTQFFKAGATFGGSGSVTITALSATSASGTFSFSLVTVPASASTQTVTNGTFTITF
jgi:hypothetical protein